MSALQKKVRRLAAALPVIVAAAGSLWAQGRGAPVIRNYTPKEYNSHHQVWSALQDTATGLLYFGCDIGLLEYDGISWRRIVTDQQYFAYDLAQGADGRIYVASVNTFGYLDHDATGRRQYRSLRTQLPDTSISIGNVWSLQAAGEEVFFCSYERIFVYNTGTRRISVLNVAEGRYFVGDFVLDGTYYVRQTGAGLLRYEEGRLVPAPHAAFFQTSNGFREAVALDAGTAFIPGRTTGLWQYRPRSTAPPYRIAFRDTAFLNANVYSAVAARPGVLAVGSLSAGAVLIDTAGRILQRFHPANGLQDAGITAFATDATGNLWMGLGNGLSKTDQGLDWSRFGPAEGLRGSVTDVVRFEGVLYATTSQGVFRSDSNGRFLPVAGIPPGQCWSFLVFQDPAGPLLLTGTHDGLFEIRGASARRITTGEHSAILLQPAAQPDRLFSQDGNRFISLRRKAGRWTLEGTWPGIDDDIRGLAEDADGSLFLCTLQNGIIRVMPRSDKAAADSIRTYTDADGLPSMGVVKPYTWNGRALFATEGGLYRFDAAAGRFEPFTDFGASFSDGSRPFYRMAVESGNRVYLSWSDNKDGEPGELVRRTDSTWTWNPLPFRRLPELSEILKLYADPDSVLWIGTSDGLFRYDRRFDRKPYQAPFKTLIRNAFSGRDSLLYGGYGPTGDIRLDFSGNTVRFEFAAPFFDQEERTQYAFQLTGFDTEWSSWGRQVSKEYTNLPEGDYVFKAKARNIYGVESSVATLPFTVLPPWYRTWWAWLIWTLAGSGTLFSGLTYYTQRLRRENERLEAIVAERTLEIGHQKKALEEQNRELQRINQTKDRFFSIIAHDVRSPFMGISGIAESLHEEADHLPRTEIKAWSEQLARGTRAVANLFENMLQWSRLELELVTAQNTELDVRQVLEEVCELFVSNASQKQLRLTLAAAGGLRLTTDRNMLATICRNLISNAIKYSAPGKEVTAAAFEEAGRLVIEIRDAGTGMDAATVERAARLEYVASQPGTQNETGTGLGLHLCYRLAERIGARLLLTSVAGSGTTARLVFADRGGVR